MTNGKHADGAYGDPRRQVADDDDNLRAVYRAVTGAAPGNKKPKTLRAAIEERKAVTAA